MGVAWGWAEGRLGVAVWKDDEVLEMDGSNGGNGGGAAWMDSLPLNCPVVKVVNKNQSQLCSPGIALAEGSGPLMWPHNWGTICRGFSSSLQVTLPSVVWRSKVIGLGVSSGFLRDLHS